MGHNVRINDKLWPYMADAAATRLTSPSRLADLAIRRDLGFEDVLESERTISKEFWARIIKEASKTNTDPMKWLNQAFCRKVAEDYRNEKLQKN